MLTVKDANSITDIIMFRSVIYAVTFYRPLHVMLHHVRGIKFQLRIRRAELNEVQDEEENVHVKGTWEVHAHRLH